ncbi:MAG: hypothetical protein ABFS09_06190 [Thermodesulfobacteriota bacterium]
MDEAIFQKILHLTEEMERLLTTTESYEELGPVLARRKEAIGSLEDDPSFNKPEAVFWLKKIKTAEERCTVLAEARKEKVRKELLAMQNGKRAVHAYSRQV